MEFHRRRGKENALKNLRAASTVGRAGLQGQRVELAAHLGLERLVDDLVLLHARLAADGRTANLMFTPDEQALKCTVAPEAFSPVPNAWGLRGATTAKLAALTVEELRDALALAWQHALPKAKAR